MNGKSIKVAIIGGGAAGCFAAVNLKRQCPGADVSVYESGRKILAKVAVTGGGRCNLTNSFAEVRSLESVYPRGHRLMKRLLKEFGHSDVCRWFGDRGVRLVTQPDQCVFPESQDAMEIVNVLASGMRRSGVNVFVSHRVTGIRDLSVTGGSPRFSLSFSAGADGNAVPDTEADIVLVTSGGSPKPGGLAMLDGLGLEIIAPVPSLFSFDIGAPESLDDLSRKSRDPGLSALMGTVVDNASVGLSGTKFRASGALLITDWGMSGPAVLKLSSYAARYLAGNGWRGKMMVGWLGEMTAEDASSMLSCMAESAPARQLSSVCPAGLNGRLWAFLLERAGLPCTKRWSELGKKGQNRLADVLTCDVYPVVGRNRFKGEFVTCGGVALPDIDPKTLESRAHPGLYFAGEVLDVDAVTGGFNLQAAWSMAYVAVRAISRRVSKSF